MTVPAKVGSKVGRKPEYQALPQNLWVRTWLQPSRGGKNTVFLNDNIASGTEYRFDDGFFEA